MNELSTSTAMTAEMSPVEPPPQDNDRLSSYANFDAQFEQMVKDWQVEMTRTQDQRLFRYIEIDVERMRAGGHLKDDETILPIRVADRNIRREQPAFVAFYTQSRRSMIFREKQTDLERAVSTSEEEQLEDAFTQGMRYPGWEIPPYSATDGAQTHGWDAVEVVYDATKPLNVSVEHVGHDKLMFPIESIDIQFSEYIARGYDLTSQQLLSFVKEFGFSADQVKTLLDSEKGTGKRALRHYRVWKILFREDDIIKVGWRCDSSSSVRNKSAGGLCSSWLKDPIPLYLGRQRKEMQEQPPKMQMVPDDTGVAMMPSMVAQPPVEVVVDEVETEFPIYLLRYHQTENQQIFSTRGRVFLDRYDQEAQTAIASGFVNKLMRSTNVYAAVGSDPTPGSTAPPKQLPVKLQHGQVYDRPVDFFSSDSPDPILLSALQWFGVRNAEENGQTDFAVNNRQDSRKTATEIQAATQQAGLLSGVQVTIYSAWICAWYKRVWEIVQNMALMGKITFLPIQQEDGTVTNNTTILAKQFYVRAAGDIDVTQRAEQVQRMQQFWPVVSATAAAPAFLRSMLITAFPNGGAQWADVIQDDQNAKQLLGQVSTILQQLIMSRPEELAALSPQEQGQLQQLQQQVQQVLAPAAGGQPQ